MKGYRIVDLSLPIINGGGFRMPAKITYIDHRTRGKALAEKFGINLEMMGGKGMALEEFNYLNCHTGTRFDAPWHSVETAEGKPAMTIDEVPLEWCFGDGVWLDLSWKKPGEDSRKATILGRLGTTQDIAHLALFLASDGSSFICGETIAITGGRTDLM